VVEITQSKSAALWLWVQVWHK